MSCCYELGIPPIWSDSYTTVAFGQIHCPLRAGSLFKAKLNFIPKTNLIMTYGGIRGGIFIALALSLALQMEHELFLTITYVIVIFSIIVQGLTI